jgi:hypothetical protein
MLDSPFEKSLIKHDPGFCVLIVVFVFVLAYGFCGCVSQPLNQNSDKSNPIVKLSLQGSVNGMNFTGGGVVPKSDGSSYQFRLSSYTDIDALILSTCAREVVFESALTVGTFYRWLDKKRTLAFTYVPTELETKGSCLLKVGSFNKGQEQANESAIFDFLDLTATLPAKLLCNGDTFATEGASFCETAEGLLQRVSFPAPVIAAEEGILPECKVEMKPSPDKTYYDFVTPRGICIYRYSELSSPFRQHRHTSRGYTKIKIQGDS